MSAHIPKSEHYTPENHLTVSFTNRQNKGEISQARELARWVTHLLFKREDLSSDPLYSYKSWVWWYMSVTQHREGGDRWLPGAGWSAHLTDTASSQFSERPCLKTKVGDEGRVRGNSRENGPLKGSCITKISNPNGQKFTKPGTLELSVLPVRALGSGSFSPLTEE